MSVPDRCDTTFELHAYTVPSQESQGTLPQVDFYEGYWAPAMRGTRMAHISGWAQRLVLRSPTSLPGRVRWLWFAAVGAIAIAIWMAVWFFLALGDNAAWSQVIKIAVAVAAPALAAALTSSLGDAARYLDNRPDNVAARAAVRNDVVTLLEKLHESGRYGRVVIVGHSLGAVVAYDALRLLWARRVRDWNATAVEDKEAAETADALSKAQGDKDARNVKDAREKFNVAQAELFSRLSKQRKDGQPIWLVSDFVSVGAPLAYPKLLLVPPSTDLDTLIKERELSSCPPPLVEEVPRPAADGGKRSAPGLPKQITPPVIPVLVRRHRYAS